MTINQWELEFASQFKHTRTNILGHYSFHLSPIRGETLNKQIGIDRISQVLGYIYAGFLINAFIFFQKSIQTDNEICLLECGKS